MHAFLPISPDSLLTASQVNQIKQQQGSPATICRSLVSGSTVICYPNWDDDPVLLSEDQIWEHVSQLSTQQNEIEAVSVSPTNEDGAIAIYFFSLIPSGQDYFADLLPFSLLIQDADTKTAQLDQLCHCY